ncbi:hypothetical protein JQ561_28910 [Bradyrhizobium diazoefficiens]|nr:hypothetical protein [Bradyrhizobium diazoefficiens]MBR0930649.1 hypothetical protein [Bradyrhizobium diazoefficiens]
MPNDKNRPPNEVTDRLFSHHLAYELWMMDVLFPELHSGKYPQHLHNAHVESFHMHARNVWEFFTLSSNCSIDPRWFTQGFSVNENFMDDELVKKINQQMSHITAKRVVGEGQLDQSHWKEIKGAIDAEVKRFESALTPEYKLIWRKPTAVKAGVGGASSQPTIPHSPG